MSTRFSRIGGLVVLAIGVLAAGGSDFAFPVWIKHPMVASLVSNAIMLAIAGLVVNAVVDSRHRRRWHAVRHVALLAMRDEMYKVDLALASPDGAWTKLAHSAPDLKSAAAYSSEGLRELASQLEQTFSRWADIVLAARTPDHDVFEGARKALIAAHDLARAERELSSRANYFVNLPDSSGGADRWLMEGYPDVESVLRRARGEALDAARATEALVNDRLLDGG